MARKEQCSQVGPRGGECRNQQLYALDFCKKHHLMVIDGVKLFCRKCDQVVDKEKRG